MLTRLRQVAGKVESVEGTAVSLAAADARILPWAPKAKINVEMFKREPARRSLSKVGQIAGVKTFTDTFGLTMRGADGAATVAPQWSKYLRASGFAELELDSLDPSTITSGPVVHGETLTQAVSGATGRAIIDTATGASVLYYIDLDTGTWDTTNTVTGGTSGATFTPATINGHVGTAWEPFSHELSEVSIGSITNGPFDEGEIITGGTSAAKGVVFESTADGASVLRFRPISGTFVTTETITGEGSSPASTTSSSGETQSEVPSLSMANYEDGRRKAGRGCRGKVKLGIKVGEPVMMEFEFMGVEDGVSDVALLTGVNHEEDVPPIAIEADLSLGGYSIAATEIGIDLSNTLAPRPDFNYENGARSVRISERDWTATIDPEAVRIAANDNYDHWYNNTLKALDVTIGSTSGNQFRIYSKRLQYTDIDDGDRDGIATDPSTFDLVGDVDNGDNEIVILAL